MRTFFLRQRDIDQNEVPLSGICYAYIAIHHMDPLTYACNSERCRAGHLLIGNPFPLSSTLKMTCPSFFSKVL
jgi:hypothetical protein